MAERNYKESNPEIIDLQEQLFEEKILSQIRQYFLSGIGEINGKEIEEKLVNLFKESKILRGKTNFMERVNDVFYFFGEDLRLEYEQGTRLKGVSQQELENFLKPISIFELENLQESIEVRMKRQGAEGTILPFLKK